MISPLVALPFLQPFRRLFCHLLARLDLRLERCHLSNVGKVTMGDLSIKLRITLSEGNEYCMKEVLRFQSVVSYGVHAEVHICLDFQMLLDFCFF